jgi:hypothetical protein
VAVSVGVDEPVSLLARSLRPLAEPASSTYDVAASPAAGVHVNATVREMTVARSAVGEAGVTMGAAECTVDRGAR